MPGLNPDIDPDGLLEFSVVFTDRSLNHMSAAFQQVMRDIHEVVCEAYNAHRAVVVPGGGSYAMEAVARQFATDARVAVIRNGFFSYRWSQIFEAGGIPRDEKVLKARRVGEGPRAPFAPVPIDEAVAAIRADKPDVVFAPHVDIREEPHLLRARGSAPFDNEGVATERRDVVRNGVLHGYFLGSYSARKLGLRSTGNAGGAHNLVVPGTEDLPALMRRMGQGLLVTEQLGQGVNPVTGDYSRGAAGFWVEDGQIAYPVEEITIASNLRDMFERIETVGSDVDRRSHILTGSILIGRMTVAGE